MKIKKLLATTLFFLLLATYLISLKIQTIRDFYTQKISTLQNQLSAAKESNLDSTEKFNYWEIIDTSQSIDFPTGLKFYENNLQDRSIIRWNDYLIGLNVEPYLGIGGRGTFDANPNNSFQLLKTIRNIRVFDIKTSQTFDISLDKPIWGDFWYMTSQVVGNKFYFGVGGAFGPNLSYSMDLPPQKNSKIIKMKEPIGSKIHESGNIIISSFCYEGCSYSLFNQSTGKNTPLTRLTAADNGYIEDRPEVFIGMDNKGNEILTIMDNTTKTIKKIVAVNATSETTERVILDGEQLPPTVKYFFMNWNTDTILMTGQSVIFSYSLSSKKFTQISVDADTISQFMSLQPLYENGSSEDGRFICFGHQHEKIIVDLEKNILGKDESICTSQPEKTVEDLFKALDLPKTFELFKTGLNFSAL